MRSKHRQIGINIETHLYSKGPHIKFILNVRINRRAVTARMLVWLSEQVNIRIEAKAKS